MAKFLIGSPSLDWITIGSYEYAFRELVELSVLPLIASDEYQSEPGKSLQYEGFYQVDAFGRAPIFLGTGTQRGKVHHLFRVSGMLADAAFQQLLKLDVNYNTSRLDVQLTLPPDGELSTALWQDFNQRQYEYEQGRGPYARKVTLVTDNGNGNTLYIGSRKSTRFIRVYQKDLEDSSLVRLEVELKDTSSKKFLKDVKSQTLDKVLYNQLNYVMRTLVSTPLLNHHRSCVNSYSAEGVWSEPRIVTSEESTLLWFAEACVGSADKLLECDHTRERFINCVDQINARIRDGNFRRRRRRKPKK